MKQLIISRDTLETRVAVLEDGRLGGDVRGAPGPPLAGGQHLQGPGGERAAPAWTPPSSTSAWSATASCTWTRCSAPRSTAGRSREDHRPAQGRQGTARAGDPGPHGRQGPAPHHGGGHRRAATWSTCPAARASGVSRRLDDAERERLRAICRDVKPEAGGVIVRTAAEGAGEEAIGRDLRFLQRVWARGGAAGAGRRARRPWSTPRRSWPCGASATCWARSSAPSSWTTRSCTGGW